MKRRTMSDLAAAQKAAESKAMADSGRTWLPSKIPDNTQAAVRFTHDADDSNDLLHVEGCHLLLPFAGMIGSEQDTDDFVAVRVPCFDQWKRGTCPVLQDTKPYWKHDHTKDFARTYYKVRTYFYTGFVVSTPSPEPSVPENPIRVFPISKQLHDRIQSGLLNAEFEMSPADPEEGRDFRIIKSKRGEFPNYDQSLFSARSRAWTEAEHEAVDKYGLVEMSTLLGTEPSAEVREQVWQMYQDSIALKPFDAKKYPDFRAWPSRRGPMAPPPLTTAAAPGPAQASPAADPETVQAHMTKLRSRVSTMQP